MKRLKKYVWLTRTTNKKEPGLQGLLGKKASTWLVSEWTGLFPGSNLQFPSTAVKALTNNKGDERD